MTFTWPDPLNLEKCNRNLLVIEWMRHFIIMTKMKFPIGMDTNRSRPCWNALILGQHNIGPYNLFPINEQSSSAVKVWNVGWKHHHSHWIDGCWRPVWRPNHRRSIGSSCRTTKRCVASWYLQVMADRFRDGSSHLRYHYSIITTRDGKKFISRHLYEQ